MNDEEFLYTCPSAVFFDNSITFDELKIYMMAYSIMDVSGDVYASSAWLAERLSLDQLHVIDCVYKLISKGYVKIVSMNDRKGIRVIQTRS